jgi:hypothetical protein
MQGSCKTSPLGEVKPPAVSILVALRFVRNASVPKWNIIHPQTGSQKNPPPKKGTKIMEKIASFTIDHIKLQPGVYVSRKDQIGAETITTFDLRMTSPNEEPVMNTAEMHTIEHLAAT